MKYPREVWAGSHIKNAPQMRRKVVLARNEYVEFINAQNNRTNVLNLDGYFRILYNNLIHNGDGNFPEDRLKVIIDYWKNRL